MLLQRAQSLGLGSQWPLLLTWLLMRVARSRSELLELIFLVCSDFHYVVSFAMQKSLCCCCCCCCCSRYCCCCFALLCLRLRWLFKISSCRDDAQRCAQSPPQSRSASHSVSVSVSVSVRVERASALAATSSSSFYHLQAQHLTNVFWLVSCIFSVLTVTPDKYIINNVHYNA